MEINIFPYFCMSIAFSDNAVKALQPIYDRNPELFSSAAASSPLYNHSYLSAGRIQHQRYARMMLGILLEADMMSILEIIDAGWPGLVKQIDEGEPRFDVLCSFALSHSGISVDEPFSLMLLTPVVMVTAQILSMKLDMSGEVFEQFKNWVILRERCGIFAENQIPNTKSSLPEKSPDVPHGSTRSEGTEEKDFFERREHLSIHDLEHLVASASEDVQSSYQSLLNLSISMGFDPEIYTHGVTLDKNALQEISRTAGNASDAFLASMYALMLKSIHIDEE